MTSFTGSIVIIVLTCASGLQHSPADEDKQKADEGMMSIETIQALIADLSDKRLSKQQNARQQLVKAGQVAIPSLTISANSENDEVSEKAIGILGVLLQSKDDEIKDAALAALEMLVETSTPAVAQRARRVMASSRVPGVALPKESIVGAEQQHTSRVSVSNVNGTKIVEVEENRRTIRIREEPGKRIEIRIDADDKTTEFKAKNAADLKRQNQQAFEVYDRFVAGNGANKLNIQAFPNGGNVSVSSSSSFSSNSSSNSNGDQAFSVAGNVNGEPLSAKEAARLLIDQLHQLKEQMNGNPQLQSIIDEQN